MQAQPVEPSVEIRLSEAEQIEQIEQAHAALTSQDPWAALVQILAYAHAEMDEAEHRTIQRDHLISRGYVRYAGPKAITGARR